jgi:glutaredoxin
MIGTSLLLFAIVWHTLTPGKYDDFAKCLTEKNVTMYGAEWCQSCKKQKMLFGKSFKYINYVECPENPVLCKEKGIERYPTWTIDGETYLGVKQLEKLSSLTGCPLS